MISEEKEEKNAIEILKNGGVAIFPTDTAFGIGCRMDDENAVERVFKIRKRPEEKAVLVLVSSIEMAQEYLVPISADVRELMNTYWPGGLTIIYPCKTDKVLESVRARGKTLGVRLPNHAIIQKVIEEVGVPLIAPSANKSGEKTPYSFSEVDNELIHNVDIVLPGECTYKDASTIIDCSKQPWKIVREGAAKLDIRFRK